MPRSLILGGLRSAACAPGRYLIEGLWPDRGEPAPRWAPPFVAVLQLMVLLLSAAVLATSTPGVGEEWPAALVAIVDAWLFPLLVSCVINLPSFLVVVVDDLRVGLGEWARAVSLALHDS